MFCFVFKNISRNDPIEDKGESEVLERVSQARIQRTNKGVALKEQKYFCHFRESDISKGGFEEKLEGREKEPKP